MRFTGLSLAILLVLLGGTLRPAAAEEVRRTPIAVLDFEMGPGVVTEAASTFVGGLREQVALRPKYALIDKNNMRRILNEQKLALKFCPAGEDEKCLIRVGEQLAVREMVTGRITLDRDAVTITMTHTDVQTAFVLHTKTIVCTCASPEEWLDVAEEIAPVFFGPVGSEYAALASATTLRRKPPPRFSFHSRARALTISGVAVAGLAFAGAGYFGATAADQRSRYTSAVDPAVMDDAHTQLVAANRKVLWLDLAGAAGVIAAAAGVADGFFVFGRPGAARVSLVPAGVLFTLTVR